MTILLYLKPFLAALIFSIILTKAIIGIGRGRDLASADAVAKPLPRSPQTMRFGGAAIILSFLLAIFLSGNLEMDGLKWGIVASSLVILFFGICDDLKNLSWKKQLMAQIAVALIMIYAGLSVDYIANPFGGAELRLDQFQYSVFSIQYSVLGSFFILFWIIGFMNVMNWLDGLDGLAGGVGAIGAVALFILNVSDLVNQPPLGIISISIVGAALGFLVFNFHPAKIYMGTSGSMFLGFILAVLAIFSGGKIATALLVLGFPILDAVWVITKRIKTGGSPFKGGDMRHLHYRLLEKGWTEKKVVLFIYLICAVFGFSTLFFQSMGKILAFLVLFFLMAAIIFGLQGNKKS